MVGSVWFCQRCIDAMASNDAQPVVSTDNPDSPDALQHALDGLRQKQQQQGKEPNQEPVQLAPLPPYDYPTTTPEPERSQGSGTPLPVQLVRDPERDPDYVPVSAPPHSTTRTRTRPFLPGRSREPEDSPTPPQPTAESMQDPVQVSPRKPAQEPVPTPKRVEPRPEPEQAPQKFREKFKEPEISPEFIAPQSKVNPEHTLEQKPEVSGRPTTPLPPKFTTKLYGKKQKRGRQRGKDRNDSTDGVRQLFELWWHRGGRGVAFPQFYRGQLSEDMRFYYPREYIHGRNTKSAAEYRQWRKEWTAKQAVKTARFT